MNNINEVFAAWQPFFTTLTVAGATLAGLLFVGAAMMPVSAMRNSWYLLAHALG